MARQNPTLDKSYSDPKARRRIGLTYSTEKPRPRFWVVLRNLSIFAGILVALFFVGTIEARSTTREIDAISGQRRITDRWFGFRTSQSVIDSPLSARLRTLQIPWQTTWKTVQVGGANIFGMYCSCGRGVDPPVDYFNARPLLVQAASPAELQWFVTKMQQAPEVHQTKIVEDIADRWGSNANPPSPSANPDVPTSQRVTEMLK